MSLHVFANIVTPFGTAANNRGETEGNITTLQKLIWLGVAHTTVSAEAIRFALRRLLAGEEPQGTNRQWNENTRMNECGRSRHSRPGLSTGTDTTSTPSSITSSTTTCSVS